MFTFNLSSRNSRNFPLILSHYAEEKIFHFVRWVSKALIFLFSNSDFSEAKTQGSNKDVFFTTLKAAGLFSSNFLIIVTIKSTEFVNNSARSDLLTLSFLPNSVSSDLTPNPIFMFLGLTIAFL